MTFYSSIKIVLHTYKINLQKKIGLVVTANLLLQLCIKYIAMKFSYVLRNPKNIGSDNICKCESLYSFFELSDMRKSRETSCQEIWDIEKVIFLICFNEITILNWVL